MIKIKPAPVVSDEDLFRNQFFSWLNDSHYWEQVTTGMINIYCCKWCNKIQPTEVNNSTLCMKNPEILKVLHGIDNQSTNKL